MAFQVHTREAGRALVIEAVGRLTLTDGRTKLRDVIHVSANEGRTRFVVNLARVDTIDSYGIGELTRCYSVVRQAGGELKLACVSPRVLEALQISHLHTVFDIHPQEEAALRAF
jgi:anti-sigma B factor antagonist